jgi:hypothetical protein
MGVGESWAGGANLGTGSDNTRASASAFMIRVSLASRPPIGDSVFTEPFFFTFSFFYLELESLWSIDYTDRHDSDAHHSGWRAC